MRIGMNFRRSAVALGLVALAIAGCGSNELESPTAVKMKALGGFYLEYAVGQNGKGPPNEAALKKHIRSIPATVLTVSGIQPSEIDGLFNSDRDGEPLVVLYGTGISQISGKSAPLVAHEKTGKNGKRLAAFANGKVELADEARLKELTASKQ